MKKLLLYGFLVAASLSVESCLFSEDDLFEQSSAERLNSSIIELKELLLSAENGWKLEYRYGSGGVEGVANIFMKFSANEVELASDFATSSYAPGETCTSMYTVKSYNGTELSFDSYNEILHAFCTPNGYGDPGYQGDYEFMIRSISDNEIHLTGKKGDVDMVMTKLASSLDWATYLQAAAKVSEESDLPFFNVIVAGQNVGRLARTYIDRSFTLSTQNQEGSVVTEYYPFICTDTGIELLEPLTYQGITLQKFTWNKADYTLTCMDEGVDVKLVYTRPENFTKYIGKYLFTGTGGALDGNIMPLELYKEGRTLSLSYTLNYTSGAKGNFRILFSYDVTTDRLYIDGKNSPGDFNGDAMSLLLGFPAGDGYYSYFTTQDFQMQSINEVDENNNMKISFNIPEDFKASGASCLLFMVPGVTIADVWNDGFSMTKVQ